MIDVRAPTLKLPQVRGRRRRTCGDQPLASRHRWSRLHKDLHRRATKKAPEPLGSRNDVRMTWSYINRSHTRAPAPDPEEAIKRKSARACELQVHGRALSGSAAPPT